MPHRLLHLALVLAANQACQALASQPARYSKIVSRKSDGRYESFPLSDPDEENMNIGKDDSESREATGAGQKSLHPAAKIHRIQSAFRSTFLPASHPGTLRSSGYLGYILYDNAQDLSTSLRSVLATKRILEGVGVGRAGATALSATLNFLIRDGCGMIASLLFTSYAAHSFRRNVKRWKYFADVMVDIGITLEIIAPSALAHPSLKGYFLPLLCLGNVCKALCGVAAGACGGALQMYWAAKLMGTEEGISEVAAKSGAQRTLMGGVGLVLAAITTTWFGDVRTAIGLYCALTFVHLFCNYRSLKLVALDWLNGWRLHRVVTEFLQCATDAEGNLDPSFYRVSTPVEATKKEPLLFLPGLRSMDRISSKYPILMGISFNKMVELTHQSPSSLHSNLIKRHEPRKDKYILAVGHASNGKLYKAKRCILVAFLSGSSNLERAKAYFHGCLVRRALASSLTDCAERRPDGGEIELTRKAEETAKRELAQLWPLFENVVTDACWKLDKTECFTEGYEMHFE